MGDTGGETQTVTIGGFRYTITHVPTTVGIRLGTRIASAVAPAFAGLTGDASIAHALGQFFRSADLGEHLVALCDGFAQYTEVELKPAKANGRGDTTPAITQTLSGCFDQHFAGRYDALIEWLTFVITWDLSSFLAGAFAASKKVSAAAEAAASKSKSQKLVAETG